MKYIGNPTWLVALAASILIFPHQTSAANVNWNVPGPADWSQGANWNPAVVPEASFDDVAVIGNGGIAEIKKTVTDVLGLQIPNGTVDIGQGGSLNVLETSSIGRSGTLRLSGNGKLDTGSLSGSGQVQLIGQDVSLKIAENYSLGNLALDIGSSGNAMVTVGGAADLRGTVSPNFASDVTIGFGDSWEFLQAASISGNPSVVLPAGGPSLPAGLKLQVSSTNGAAALTVGNVPTLSVDRVSGAMSINNLVGDAITLTAYSIGSASGLLKPDTWTTLSANDDAWRQANPRPQRLAELNLSGEISLGVGEAINLGSAYNATQGASPRDEDVTFDYLTVDGIVSEGLVEFSGPANDLVLRVDPETGQADLRHQSQFIDPFDITFYSLLSDAGSLSVAGWNSFANSGAAGEGWTKANPRDEAIAELNLSNSQVFSNGTVIPLGALFKPGSAQDLTFEFGTVDGQIHIGTVEYALAPGFDCDGDGVVTIADADCTSAADIANFLSSNGFPPGDINGDGQVTFPDFLVLSTNFNQPGSYTQGDLNKDGTVAFADFLILSSNFGPPAGAVSSVPEPNSVAMLAFAACLLFTIRGRRCRWLSTGEVETMQRLTINLFAMGVGFLFLSPSAFGQTETQAFDSEQSAADAGWIFNDEGQNPERGCPDCFTDLGWKDSDFAGGSAGEGGGSLHRAGSLPIGFYGDLSIGSLSLNTKIEASGKIALLNTNFDGSAHLGFFDGVRLSNDPLNYGAELGVVINEPGGGVAPNFRWGTRIRTNDGSEAGGGGFVDGLFDSEPLEFSISYDPAEGDFGVLSVEIGDDTPAELVLSQALRESAATFTAFGIYTGPFIGSADARSMEILIDDVTYTSLGTALVPGDFNSDGKIDTSDFLTLASNFNTKGKEFTDGDIDFNGTVDGVDFQAFRTIFNSLPAGAAAAVPEPGGCLLLVMGLLGIAR